jgi:formylglycine-generating enzyme required for sulfatase activity
MNLKTTKYIPGKIIPLLIVCLSLAACEERESEDRIIPLPYKGDLNDLPNNLREERTGMEFILVKPGEFMMGSGDGETGEPAERPRHRVTVSRPYYLGRYEVTIGQFQDFIEDTGYRTNAEERGKASGWDGRRWGKKKGINWKNPGFNQVSDHPVVCVSLNDGRAFCRWLGDGYRIPSEAEWEYAARAGTDTAFYWGTGLDEVCRYANGGDLSAARIFEGWNTSSCDDGYAWTAPVGSYLPNRWGFHNLAGNAWEWCEDAWHGSFSGAPPDQGVWGDLGGGGKRVLRGGAWYFEPQDLYVAVRNSHRDYEATNGAGFRVLKDIPDSCD